MVIIHGYAIENNRIDVNYGLRDIYRVENIQGYF